MSVSLLWNCIYMTMQQAEMLNPILCEIVKGLNNVFTTQATDTPQLTNSQKHRFSTTLWPTNKRGWRDSTSPRDEDNNIKLIYPIGLDVIKSFLELRVGRRWINLRTTQSIIISIISIVIVEDIFALTSHCSCLSVFIIVNNNNRRRNTGKCLFFGSSATPFHSVLKVFTFCLGIELMVKL